MHSVPLVMVAAKPALYRDQVAARGLALPTILYPDRLAAFWIAMHPPAVVVSSAPTAPISGLVAAINFAYWFISHIERSMFGFGQGQPVLEAPRLARIL